MLPIVAHALDFCYIANTIFLVELLLYPIEGLI